MADNNWDNRLTFEGYLYDYLVKRNMHQTAEVFRKEANLALVAGVPPAIDVPEGFLLEWWAVSFEFDFFRAWLQLHEKQRLEEATQRNASQSEQYEQRLEEATQAKKQLQNNFNSPLSKGSKSMASHVSGESSQLFSPSSHREELLTSTPKTGNVANTSGQKVESLVHNTSKAESTAFNEDTDPVIENLLSSFWMFEQDQKELCDKSILGESSRNMKNLLAFEEGNTGMHEVAGFTSPALQDDDNKSETSDCSSNFRILSATTDASTVHHLEPNKER